MSNKPIPAGNPLANIIVVIVVALAIAAAIILGVFAFVALGGIVLVLAAVLGIRVWWLDRKKAKGGEASGGRVESGPDGKAVIDGEYRVISETGEGKRPDKE